jgi:hypothetical protein
MSVFRTPEFVLTAAALVAAAAVVTTIIKLLEAKGAYDEYRRIKG